MDSVPLYLTDPNADHPSFLPLDVALLMGKVYDLEEFSAAQRHATPPSK